MRRISGPALHVTNEEGERFYPWTGQQILPPGAKPWPGTQYWSVTTLIGAGYPKFLHAHYAKMSSELAYADVVAHGRRQARSLVTKWAKEGRVWVKGLQDAGGLTSIKPAERLPDDELALRWLKGAAPRHRDTAAEKGTAVHEEAEDLILACIGELLRLNADEDSARVTIEKMPSYSKDIAGRMESFKEWVNDFRPVFVMTEASVFSHHGYAGTVDAGVIIKVGGRDMLVMVDYKSGRDIYPDHAIQLSAYMRADWVGLKDGTALPLPEFERAAILHLTDKGYRFRWVDTSYPVYRVFIKGICEVGRFRLALPGMKSIASTVLGEDIAPDIEEAS